MTPATEGNVRAPSWMAKLGLREGEWLHASKPALRRGMRPTFALKTRFWRCGILHAHDYQFQCAYTMFRGHRLGVAV